MIDILLKLFTGYTKRNPPSIGSAAYFVPAPIMDNGQFFNPGTLVCGSWFYPFGTELDVTSLSTGRTVRVVVSDRAPKFAAIRQGRILYLSIRAFISLGGELELGSMSVVVIKVL